jgi:hypothetical protein
MAKNRARICRWILNGGKHRKTGSENGRGYAPQTPARQRYPARRLSNGRFRPLTEGDEIERRLHNLGDARHPFARVGYITTQNPPAERAFTGPPDDTRLAARSF